MQEFHCTVDEAGDLTDYQINALLKSDQDYDREAHQPLSVTGEDPSEGRVQVTSQQDLFTRIMKLSKMSMKDIREKWDRECKAQCGEWIDMGDTDDHLKK